MMGVLINPSSNSLPIINSPDYIALYGIMNRVGLFSDSTHSIHSAFTPLELFFFCILFFFSLFILPLFSHPFIVILLLLGVTKLLILFFKFPMNELKANSRIQASWLFPTRYLENCQGSSIVSLRVIECPSIILSKLRYLTNSLN